MFIYHFGMNCDYINLPITIKYNRSDDTGEDNDEMSLLDARHSSNSWWRSIYIVLQLFVMRLLVNLGLSRYNIN